ncbi:hypothetical protein TNCV_3572491 [Trichonephila clavipes]|nr:hypothetical protein TNCV_3572491 [Trichonephila clavipes]
MPRASTKVFKKRKGVFNKGRCNKSNDGCGELNSTVPKNSADEKIVLMAQKLCITNETELSASDGVPSTNRGCYEQNTIVYKKQRKLGRKKRLKRKKEDDELLKNADDLEYGAKMF